MSSSRSIVTIDLATNIPPGQWASPVPATVIASSSTAGSRSSDAIAVTSSGAMSVSTTRRRGSLAPVAGGVAGAAPGGFAAAEP